MLTRKTFNMIAGVIKHRRETPSARDLQSRGSFGTTIQENIKQNVLSDLVTMLAYEFSLDNPMFDTARFVEASRKSTEAEIVKSEGRS